MFGRLSGKICRRISYMSAFENNLIFIRKRVFTGHLKSFYINVTF